MGEHKGPFQGWVMRILSWYYRILRIEKQGLNSQIEKTRFPMRFQMQTPSPGLSFVPAHFLSR